MDLRLASSGAFCALLATACVVESRDYSWGDPGPPPSSGSSGGSSAPMLVTVDPDQVMTIAPGEGVGVFVEYATGGHWHVSWTADSKLSGVSRSFDLRLSVGSGSFANVATEGFGGRDTLVLTDASHMQASTSTYSEADGLTFDTDPGAVLTIDAAVDSLRRLDGVNTFFFFVQDGMVNGGYTGPLTNPLMFQASL